MMIPKLELGRIALVVAATGGYAFAGDAPAQNDPPPTPSQQPAQQPDGSTTEACPLPPQTAQAEPVPQQGYQGAPPPQAEPVPVESRPYDWVHDFGLAISIGGGVDDFSNQFMRNMTGTGGSWNARVTFGTRSYLAGEASYIGSAQSITALGLANNTELIGNGAQAALRLNGTIDYPIQPFAYGGAAWRHYSLNTNTTNLSDVLNSDDAFEIPVGGGIAGYWDELMLDVRGEYRFAWVDKGIVLEPDGGKAVMNRWGVTGNIGYRW